MYIRLYGNIYGYDVETDNNGNEGIKGESKIIGRFIKPLIINVTEKVLDSPYSYYGYYKVLTHEIFNGKYVLKSDQFLKLLVPGDTVILSRTNQKVIVYGSGKKSFSYYQNGILKRRPYVYSDGTLSFRAYKFVNESIDDNTDWMDENLKYNYDCFYKIIKEYYPSAKDKYIYNEFKTWYEAKKDLIELFRKHPNWNEKEKCIAVDMSIKRNVEMYKVTLAADNLFNIMSETPVFSRSTLRAFTNIRSIFTSSYNYREEDGCIRLCSAAYASINSYLNGIGLNDDDMNVEAKVSRNINAIMKKFKVTDNPEYNKASAKCFDEMAIKPLHVKFIMSLNICDFITMSHGNSWTSCHSLKNHGGWHAGCLSYANDDTTIITYGLEKDCPSEAYYKYDKIFRQLFMINKERTEYVQSRMYPASNVYTYESVNKGFNSILSEVGINISNEPAKSNSGSVISGEGYLNYPDYLNFRNSCRRYGSNESLIKIGAGVNSLANGMQLTSTNSLTGVTRENLEIIIWCSNINKSEYLAENE